MSIYILVSYYPTNMSLGKKIKSLFNIKIYAIFIQTIVAVKFKNTLL